MAQHSSIHVYQNWAKERIDEMDASLTVLEGKTGRLKAEQKAKGDRLIADLKARRDKFKATVKEHAQAGEAAWQRTKAELDAEWCGYEELVKAYFDGVSWELEQDQAALHDVAAAQVKAWREAADAFRAEALKVAAVKRAEVDAAVKHMQADASEAEARFQKLKQAGEKSWSAFSAALSESRKAFDRANQQASTALKRAAS